jgi:hypothetical protein
VIQNNNNEVLLISPVLTNKSLFVFRCCAIIFILFVLLQASFRLSAQTTDSIARTKLFSGAVTLTTKGLSTFPNLTLGKPAAIIDLSMGGQKLRFEPQFRFSLEGKPWTFIFWCRYEVLNSQKFQFKIGAHPAYSFKTIMVVHNGTEKEVLRAQQFLAGELTTVFKAGKNFSFGPYYIYSRGLEKDIVQNSNFFSLRMNLSKITLTPDLYLRWIAQAYYLKMDANDGYYVNSTLYLLKNHFPLSLSSTINKAIETTIPGDDFLWNINLTFSFGGNYKKI